MVCRDLGMPEAESARKRTVPVFGLSRVVGTDRMKSSRQTTLRSQATVTGVGVHSGVTVNLTLGPAPVDAGFIFVRVDPDGTDREDLDGEDGEQGEHTVAEADPRLHRHEGRHPRPARYVSR